MPDIVPGAGIVVRNRRHQPVELHLPSGVVVLAPQGQCVLDGASAASPQLAWLVARKAVQLQAAAALPAAAASAPRAPKPKAAKKAVKAATQPASKTPRSSTSKPKRKTP